MVCFVERRKESIKNVDFSLKNEKIFIGCEILIYILLTGGFLWIWLKCTKNRENMWVFRQKCVKKV